MPIKQLVKVAIRALQTNKSRSLLTALGVIIGVASVILLVSVGSGLKDYITNQMQDMGSNLIMVIPGDIDLDKIGPSAGGSGAMGSAFSSMTSSKLELADAYEIEKAVPQIQDAAAMVTASSLVRYKG